MLSDCRHLRFRNFNSTVPIDVVRVKSYVKSLVNSTRVPVRVSVNKLNFVPERIKPGLIGVFRNGRRLSSSKPYIPMVPLNPSMHAPSHFPNVHFAAFTRNLRQNRYAYSRMNGLRSTIGMYGFHELKRRPSLKASIRPSIISSVRKF